MNLLDVAFLLVLAFSVLGGLVRGFVREVLGLVGLVLGVVLAIMLAPAAARLLERWMFHGAAYAISFLVIFFLTAAVAALVGHLITRFVEKLRLSMPNRLAGGLFGLARGALTIIVLFWGLLFFVDGSEPLITGSRLAPFVLEGAQWLGRLLPGPDAPTNQMI